MPSNASRYVAAIEAGDICWSIFDRRRADARESFGEIESHGPDPRPPWSRFLQHQTGTREQRPVIDDLASLDVTIEKLVGERAIARDLRQNPRRSCIVYGRATVPSTAGLGRPNSCHSLRM